MGAGNFVSNNCRVVPTRLTATTATVCLTAKGYTQVIGIRVVNFHVSAVPAVSVQYKPAGGATAYFIEANFALQVAGSLWFAFDAFGCNDSDEIIVTSSIADTTDVLVLIAEVPGRST